MPMVRSPSMSGPLMVPPQILSRGGGITLVPARLYDSDGNALFDSEGRELYVLIPAE